MSCRNRAIHFTSIIGLNYPVCTIHRNVPVHLPISINTHIHRIKREQCRSLRAYDLRRRISLGPRWNRNKTFSCEPIVNLSTWHDNHDDANIYNSAYRVTPLPVPQAVCIESPISYMLGRYSSMRKRNMYNVFFELVGRSVTNCNRMCIHTLILSKTLISFV